MVATLLLSISNSAKSVYLWEKQFKCRSLHYAGLITGRFEEMSHPWDGKSEGAFFANALHQGESCGINFKSF